MKRIIYILLLIASTSLTFTACTEEEITPLENNPSSGGGHPIDPLK